VKLLAKLKPYDDDGAFGKKRQKTRNRKQHPNKRPRQKMVTLKL